MKAKTRRNVPGNEGLKQPKVRSAADGLHKAVQAELTWEPVQDLAFGDLPAHQTARPLRQTALLNLQRSFGNSYVQRFLGLTARPGTRVQRQDDTEDAGSDSEPEPVLRNPRFAGNETLLIVLRGEEELSRSHNGEPVHKVQQALFDMAYPLPRFRVDGKLGSETDEAVRRFRSDRKLAPGTQVDSDAMSELDKAAPPPGKSAGKTVDYKRLLEDGRLTFTVAIGYDEGGTHKEETERLIDFLLGLGFSGELGEDGIGLFKKKHTFSYEDPDARMSVSKEVDVVVRAVTPSTPGAKEEFAEGLSQSDITIYSGHARYGTGPDFDHNKKPAENFTIGVGSALHKSGRLKRPPGQDASWYHGHYKMKRILDKRVNDLEAMTAAGQLDPKKYQLWFFNACSTLHYLDELRSPELMGDKTRENLDIIGTRRSISQEAGIRATQAFIQSILQMQTLDELMGSLQGAQDEVTAEFRAEGRRVKTESDMFFGEGFGDNPTAIGAAKP